MSDESEIRPEEQGEGTVVAVGTGDEGISTHVDIPPVRPVLPLKNTVLFPFLLSPLLVSSTRSKRLIDEVLLSPHRLLVCVAVRHAVEVEVAPVAEGGWQQRGGVRRAACVVAHRGSHRRPAREERPRPPSP